MRYDVHGNRIVQINGPSDHEVYPTPDFVHLIFPASGVTSTQIQITGFGERIARKKIQGPTLRTAWNTSPAFDPDVIGPLGGMALLGLLVWGARRGAFVLVVRRPGHAAASLAATLGLVVTPKVWAGGGGGPEVYWEIADPLGSGLLLIGENGLRAREFSFTPFGEPRSAVGGATSLRNNYAGHRYDEASGLVYMNARWYEPGSGRFMSVDPVLRTGAPQSHNAYSYVENNPIAANDPTGMCLSICVWFENVNGTLMVVTAKLLAAPAPMPTNSGFDGGGANLGGAISGIAQVAGLGAAGQQGVQVASGPSYENSSADNHPSAGAADALEAVRSYGEGIAIQRAEAETRAEVERIKRETVESGGGEYPRSDQWVWRVFRFRTAPATGQTGLLEAFVTPPEPVAPGTPRSQVPQPYFLFKGGRGFDFTELRGPHQTFRAPR